MINYQLVRLVHIYLYSSEAKRVLWRKESLITCSRNFIETVKHFVQWFQKAVVDELFNCINVIPLNIVQVQLWHRIEVVWA